MRRVSTQSPLAEKETQSFPRSEDFFKVVRCSLYKWKKWNDREVTYHNFFYLCPVCSFLICVKLSFKKRRPLRCIYIEDILNSSNTVNCMMSWQERCCGQRKSHPGKWEGFTGNGRVECLFIMAYLLYMIVLGFQLSHICFQSQVFMFVWKVMYNSV